LKFGREHALSELLESKVATESVCRQTAVEKLSFFPGRPFAATGFFIGRAGD
jgi:hypothetical protein